MRVAPHAAVTAVLALLLVLASPARAHDVTPTVVLPSPAPAEDIPFTISFNADVRQIAPGPAYLSARIRPAGAVACAARQQEDPGTVIAFNKPIQTGAAVSATYTPPVAGDYLLCAWVEDAAGSAGPVASTVLTVRAPVLQAAMVAPTVVRRGETFSLVLLRRVEAPRFVRSVLIRTPSCSTSYAAMRRMGTSRPAHYRRALEQGQRETSARVAIDGAGTYRLCTYFEEPQAAAQAPFVLDLGTIEVRRDGVTGAATCGGVAARRPILRVTAMYVACSVAERIARRVGDARGAPPRRVGRFRCGAVAPRRVTCRSRALVVRIEFAAGRRPPRADPADPGGIGGGDG